MTEEIRAEGVSYTPPIVDPAPASPPVKKRGRPPKNKTAATKTAATAPTAVASSNEPPKENEKVLLDDDDDNGDLSPEQVFTPRPSPFLSARLPGSPMGSPQQLRQQAIQQQQTVNDDFEAHLSSLEFEGGHHTVTVHRVEPEFDPNSGKRIAGYLAKFTRAVTFEEIRSQYGGGKYRFVVHGPGPFGKPTIKANKVYEIAGDPILPRSANAAQVAPQPMIPDAVSDIVDKAISTHEKTADRLAVENRELTREMKQMLLATLNKGDGGLKDTMMTMISEERKLAEQRAVEERRLQEQRLAAERQAAKETRDLILSTMAKSEQSPQQLQAILMEERRLQEQRMLSEREERRREQEASERRHQQTLEMMRMQQEKQIEAMRIEQERVRAEARATEERARQQFELQLRQLEKQESQKEMQSLKMTEFMASLQAQQVQQMQLAQQTQLQQMQQFTQLERDFMLKQIDSLSKKDTGIDQMLKFKQLFDTITGKDNEGGGEQRETWEKIMDRINDSVPGIVAAAGLLRGSAPQASAPQTAPPPRVLPGSVAVVEVDDEDDRVSMQRRNLRRRRRLQPPPQARTAPSSAQSTSAATTPIGEATESVNDFADFVFPQEATPVEQSLEMLVKNIDLAIQRELSAGEIDEQIIKKFPPTVAALVANTDVDTLLGVLEARAPSSWRINSLDGQQKVRELHTLLAKAG